MMARIDKLGLVAEAIKVLPPIVRERGKLSPATAAQPQYCELDIGGFHIILTEGALLTPVDEALSSMLDIWPSQGTGKLLSVSWMPDKPWLPPRVVQCKAGDWQRLLTEPA
jgi:hypothetical protein